MKKNYDPITLYAKIDTILDTCNKYFGVNYDVLKDINTRRRSVVERRQIAMYFLRRYTELSLADIGDLFKKDHATVLYSVNSIRNLMQTDKDISAITALITRELHKIYPVIDVPQKTIREELLEIKIVNHKLVHREINRRHHVKRIEEFINQLPLIHKENYKKWMAHS